MVRLRLRIIRKVSHIRTRNQRRRLRDQLRRGYPAFLTLTLTLRLGLCLSEHLLRCLGRRMLENAILCW